MKKLLESFVETNVINIDPSLNWTNNHYGVIDKFLGFCKEKLKINKVPNINMILHPKENMTTGMYDPSNNKIYVRCGGRLLVDCLRSLAHEVVHHHQKERGDLENPIQDIGGPEENEANAVAGSLIKEYSYKFGKKIYEL
jgi:hypothetical protein